MRILNQEHYDACIKFATEIGQLDGTEGLQTTLNRLQWFEDNRNQDVYLYKDFAPYSFYFEMWDKDIPEKQRNRDNRWLNGGAIYHGSHDGGGNGGAPTFSVNLSPVSGWAIHT